MKLNVVTIFSHFSVRPCGQIMMTVLLWYPMFHSVHELKPCPQRQLHPMFLFLKLKICPPKTLSTATIYSANLLKYKPGPMAFSLIPCSDKKNRQKNCRKNLYPIENIRVNGNCPFELLVILTCNMREFISNLPIRIGVV